MCTPAQEHRDTHRAFVLAILLVYALVTWTIPLLHDDDCSASHGTTHSGTSLPCDGACPACKFLAGSNATPVFCNSGDIVIQAETILESPGDLQSIVTHSCMGSIILRGPPAIPILSLPKTH